MRRSVTLALTLFALLVMAGSAQASQLIDRNAANIKLKVSRDGKAMVSYNAHGRHWDVLAWGAVNALHPNKAKKQFQFRLEAGQIQYVANREIGHSRTAFHDFEEVERRRLLIRLWLRNEGAQGYIG